MYKWKLVTINDVRDHSEDCFNYNLEEFLNKNKVIDYKIIYSIKHQNGRISTADILYKVKIKSKNKLLGTILEAYTIIVERLHDGDCSRIKGRY
jgi:hypothetical protein